METKIMFYDTPPTGKYLTVELPDGKNIYLKQVKGDTFHTIIRTIDSDLNYNPKYYAWTTSGNTDSCCFSLLSLLEVPNIEYITTHTQFQQLLMSIFSLVYDSPKTVSYPETWRELIHPNF